MLAVLSLSLYIGRADRSNWRNTAELEQVSELEIDVQKERRLKRELITATKKLRET